MWSGKKTCHMVHGCERLVSDDVILTVASWPCKHSFSSLNLYEEQWRFRAKRVRKLTICVQLERKAALLCSREYPKVAKLCIDFLINEQCPCDKSFYSCDLDWCSPRQNLKTALYHSSGDSIIFLLGEHSYFSVQSTLRKWHFSFWSTDLMKILFFFSINSVIFLLGQHYGTEQVILQIK